MEEKITRILGLGVETGDGHLRITTGSNYKLLFGSEDAHAEMQELCMKLEASLKASGQRLEDLSREEFLAKLRALSASEDSEE